MCSVPCRSRCLRLDAPLPWTVNPPSPAASSHTSIPHPATLLPALRSTPTTISSPTPPTASLPSSLPGLLGERAKQGPLRWSIPLVPPQFTPHVTWILLAGDILLWSTTLPSRISSDVTKIEIRTSLSQIHNVCSLPTNIRTLVLISLPATAHSSNQSYHHFQPLPPLIPPLDESSFSFDRHDAYSSYPPMGSLSISAPSSAHVTSPESPDIHSTYRSDTRSLDFGSNDEESSHKGKRRRQQSLDTDDNARKSRNPRKTAVACNFCRGTCIFFITKNYLSALIIAFFRSQVALQRHQAFLLQLHCSQL